MSDKTVSRERAIQIIFQKHGKYAIYVTNTGYISRAVYKLFPDMENIFYMQGSMGLAPAIGLGIAEHTDMPVVVLSGDGALLMHLGITHTIRDSYSKNLYVYVLDNGSHESVGDYPVSQLQRDVAGQCSYPGIDKILKIKKDGKLPRVGIDCVQNAINIKEEIKNG